MKMENIMNYKIYLYALFLFLSIYIFSGVNFEKIMKKDKVIEARLLVMTLSIALSYLLTNFMFDFLNLY
ncbi:MAG: DUF1146 domain-containing protein [Firmicutes bacterium]|nr:DUF1146 domain-containing protein [Bacillota bacterium]